MPLESHTVAKIPTLPALLLIKEIEYNNLPETICWIKIGSNIVTITRLNISLTYFSNHINGLVHDTNDALELPDPVLDCDNSYL